MRPMIPVQAVLKQSIDRGAFRGTYAIIGVSRCTTLTWRRYYKRNIVLLRGMWWFDAPPDNRYNIVRCFVT